MFSELHAECSVLSGINGHGSMKPCLLQMRTEPRSNTGCSVCRQAAKGNQAVQGVTFSFNPEETEDIFSVLRLKGG